MLACVAAAVLYLGDDETWFISRDLETNEPLWRTIVPLRTGGGPNRREESNGCAGKKK